MALLRRGREVRFCRGLERGGRHGHSGLDSSVVRLIEALYSEEERWSFAWLRGRILTTEAKGVASAATVKVAARRVSWNLAPGEIWESVEDAGSVVREVHPPEDWPAAESSAERPDASSSACAETLEPVVARLSWEGAFILAVNRARRHRTRHAEVRVVREWLIARSRGSAALGRVELRVTLKCCKMCAAWIFEAFAGRVPFEVLFDEPDPGPLGRFTALEAGSPQRAEAVSILGLAPDWLAMQVERQAPR